ncbi:unnamed protein product [Linum trigynum]|uniref:F-box domain-containing protein n=1 Tax=Linum trigynum TaxID=586398 RepID=A0AAV2G153_9ROSI
MSPESCNSRHFSWLVKSCLPNPTHHHSPSKSFHHPISAAAATTTLSSLPDDLLLDCLARVPSASLPALSAVCRRWSHLLDSASFLSLRRLRGLLRPTLFAFSSSDSPTLFAASLLLHRSPADWNVEASSLPFHSFSPEIFAHARLAAVGPTIYILARAHTLCYHIWTDTVSSISPMVSPRKKFASAVVSGKIYVAGGGVSTRTPAVAAVEEYDPVNDAWRVVSQAPRRRYGCVGAAVDGVFYVIGGLKIAGPEAATTRAGAEACAYASSMDLYDVETRAWLRSRAVPGGGCVVAACAAGGFVYVLASHAVELSFWRFDARRGGGGCGFGEWSRVKSPPVPQQMRLVDGTVRFGCVAVEEKVVMVQVIGSIDDLLRRSGRSGRGLREGLVLVYDPAGNGGGGEWSRGPDLPEVIRRAACVTVEC